MKTTVVLAAFAVSRVYAQTSYSTETYTSCDTTSDATVTGTKTMTGPCTHEACTETAAPRSGHVTTWVTSWTALCPTATADNYQKVYTTTVTESCTEATPTWSHTAANYVPPSWTTGKMVCTECGSAPVTMPHATYPIAVAPSGTVVPEKMQSLQLAPAPTGSAPVSPGASSPAAPASAPGSPAAAASPVPGSTAPGSPAPAMPEAPMGSAPAAPAMPEAPMGGSAPAPGAPAGGAPAPMAAASGMMPSGSSPAATAAAAPVCPGPACHENMAAGATPLSSPSNSTSPLAYHGAAGALSHPYAALFSLLMAIAAAVFML